MSTNRALNYAKSLLEGFHTESDLRDALRELVDQVTKADAYLAAEASWDDQPFDRVRTVESLAGSLKSIYDPNFGDDRKCACGHEYRRHFDPWENMNPVGCKYCYCMTFKEP